MHTSASLNRFVETAIACSLIAGARDVELVNGEDWEVKVIFQADTESEEERFCRGNLGMELMMDRVLNISKESDHDHDYDYDHSMSVRDSEAQSSSNAGGICEN